jgi:hypothetical protein
MALQPRGPQNLEAEQSHQSMEQRAQRRVLVGPEHTWRKPDIAMSTLDFRATQTPGSIQLDRITFTCGTCQVPGGIASVAINITHLFLEGQCPQCGHTSYYRVELIIADAFATMDTSTIQ